MAKVRSRGRRPEDAKKALVSSTQNWSFRASGSITRRLGRRQ